MKKSALTCLAILIAGCLFCGTARAQSVRAEVDRTRIAPDESTRLTVTIAGAEGSVDTGPIEDFTVISEGTTTSIQIINGRTSRETIVTFSLIPLKEGHLVVPALPVAVGGKTHSTREISIQVNEKPPSDASRRDVFAEAVVSTTAPFVGEQISFFLRLYHAVRIADPSVLKVPEFEGFSATPWENRKGYRATRDGRKYKVQELAFVLVPLSPGEKIIPAALIGLDVYRQDSRPWRRGPDRSFEDHFFGRGLRETRRLKTRPIGIDVRPLPADEQSALPFSGLVGEFTLESTLENNQLSVGDATTLAITLAGAGNLMDAALPDLKVPQGLKIYADAPQETIGLTEKGYAGKKAFRIALVGVSPGTYPIEPLRIRYFDLAQKRFETLSTAAAVITVTPSAEEETFRVATGAGPAAPLELTGEKVEFTGRDILPIKEDLDTLKNRRPMGLPLFSLLLCAPALLCLGAWFYKKASRQNGDPAILMAKRAEAALREADGSPDDRFFSSLSRALISAILARAGIMGASLTYREAEEILTSTGLNPDLARAAGALLDRIDSTRYGGKTLDAGARQALSQETRSIVKQVIRS